MEQAMTCNVCSETFSNSSGRIPRILTACGHSFCETCLMKLQNKESVSKYENVYEGGSINRKRKVDKVDQYSIRCPNCKKETVSKLPSDHMPKNYGYLDLITEVVKNGREKLKFCQVHPNYILDMFCHDDEEIVCLDCSTYGMHKTHKVSKLSWFSDKQADSLQRKINCIDDVVGHYEDLRSNLEPKSRKQDLAHKVKYIQNAITSRFSQLQLDMNTILNAKQESVLVQLEKYSSSQLSLLEVQGETAANFIHKLGEQRNLANNFLTKADESKIAKEKNLHSDMAKCINEAQSHKMLTNSMFEVQMDTSDHIVENVKEMFSSWVCNVKETEQEPSLEAVSAIWEKQIPCSGDIINVLFSEEGEMIVHNPFEGIDCKFLCDGKLQDCAADSDQEDCAADSDQEDWAADSDGETDCDLVMSD